MFWLAKCTVRAEKGTCSASKGGQKALSAILLGSIALMTRFSAYVSAARARNTDARPITDVP